MKLQNDCGIQGFFLLCTEVQSVVDRFVLSSGMVIVSDRANVPAVPVVRRRPNLESRS